MMRFLIYFSSKIATLMVGLLFFAFNAMAQYESANWCFGDSFRVDFTNGSPQVSTFGSFETNRGDAAISDKNGNLEMYVVNEVFQGRTAKLIDGNNNIIKDSLIMEYSAPSHIIKINDSIYYCFYQNFFQQPFRHCNAKYTKIKKNVSSFSVTDFDVSFSNFKLDFGLIFIKHNDEDKWWMLSHNRVGDIFYKFLVNANTVQFVDSQSIGALRQYTNFWSSHMRASQSGSKIVSVHTTTGTELYDFDRCSGQLSNYDLVSNITYGITDACFSSNERMLYVNYWLKLVQYNLDSLLPINNGIVLWENPNYLPSGPNLSTIGLKYNCIDQKIYVCHPYWQSGLPLDVPESKYIGVIHSPDTNGIASNYNFWGLYLGSRRGPSTFMGSNPNYNLQALGTAYAYRQNGQTAPPPVCQGDSVQLGETFKEKGITYHWQPATGLSCTTCHNPKAAPNQTTTYTLYVTNSNGCGLTADTATVTVQIIPTDPLTINAGTDTTLCAGQIVTLGAVAQTGVIYQWQPDGQTTAQISVSPTQTTVYTLTAKAGETCLVTAVDSVKINVLPVIQLVADAGKDTAICAGASVILGAAAVSGQTYLWNTGDTTAQITITPSLTTIYSLKVSGSACSLPAADSVTITVSPFVQLTADAGQDTTLCGGDSILLGAPNVSGQTYLWNTGAATAQIRVSPAQTTIYSLTVSKQGCFSPASDSVTVTVLPKNQPPCVTDIVEPLLRSQYFTIYPNPAQNNFTIAHSESATLEIVNLVGQTVLKSKLTDEGETQISTENWPNGVYLCNFTTENGRFTNRLIIAR